MMLQPMSREVTAVVGRQLRNTGREEEASVPVDIKPKKSITHEVTRHSPLYDIVNDDAFLTSNVSRLPLQLLRFL